MLIIKGYYYLFVIFDCQRYFRLVKPNYHDGYHLPPISVTGVELPSARLISNELFGIENITDPQLSLANMQWGQIITHDMSLRTPSISSGTNNNTYAFYMNIIFTNARTQN